MKTFLLSLLALALCLHTAHSLKCYSCTVEKNSDCKDYQECSPSEKYCQTGIYEYDSNIAIIKTCTDTCFPFSSQAGSARASVSCCQTDLCDHSRGRSAASVRISNLALVISVGFVGSLLGAGF
ncbi:lymphocyte antigen 6E-like [Microcaecilia unicolor]|uniref:Lymphocyte antigen 6E-like n=1 Tax=Microcaecilia unicolor TaxID=1415580 RepID=A0A6P7WSC1_9AMPH|nr:lymphocyte antigen 6E-like [Microcaecilia unicolor]